MDDKTAAANGLLQITEDDLYLDIGLHLYGRPALAPSREEAIQRAKRWFSLKRKELANVVCTSDRLKALARQDVPTHELVVTVCGVLDVVTHIMGGVPGITVSALLVRLGLHEFCADLWESKHQHEDSHG